MARSKIWWISAQQASSGVLESAGDNAARGNTTDVSDSTTATFAGIRKLLRQVRGALSPWLDTCLGHQSLDSIGFRFAFNPTSEPYLFDLLGAAPRNR